METLQRSLFLLSFGHCIRLELISLPLYLSCSDTVTSTQYPLAGERSRSQWAYTSNGLTIRVRDLSPETIEDDVARFCNGRDGPSGIVIANNSIGNLVPEVNRTKLMTVKSVKQEFKVKALRECHGISFSDQRGDGTLIVSVEDELTSLATLHCAEGQVSSKLPIASQYAY